MSLFSFGKDEILRKKKLIDQLFAEGHSFFSHPFKIFFLPIALETQYPVQILISVSKRSFKHATDRNRIKRQIREAYRLNKGQLYSQLRDREASCAVAIIYTAHVHLETDYLETKIKVIQKRLITELDKKLNNPSLSLSD
jgi:ribonuclease P protein component